MKLALGFSLCSFLVLTYACGDDHAHDHAHERTRRAQPGVGATITPPSRPLVWGDLNVIHTTDSHGWLLGHQKASAPEPNYSGDFGDFASFVTHMKQIAEVRLSRLFLRYLGFLPHPKTVSLCRRRMSTSCSLIQATCMMGPDCPTAFRRAVWTRTT